MRCTSVGCAVPVNALSCEGPYTGNILIFLSIINIYIILYKKIYKGFAWIYIISCISKQIPLNIICSLRVFRIGLLAGCFQLASVELEPLGEDEPAHLDL